MAPARAEPRGVRRLVAAWAGLARHVLLRKAAPSLNDSQKREFADTLDRLLVPVAAAAARGDVKHAQAALTEVSHRLVLARFLHQERPRFGEPTVPQLPHAEHA